MKNNKVEKHPNFKVKLARNYVKITSGNSTWRSYPNLSEYTQSWGVQQNKRLFLSERAYEALEAYVDDCVLKDELNYVSAYGILKPRGNYGGIFIEYFDNCFHITNYKGMRQVIKTSKLLKFIFPNLNGTEVEKIRNKIDNPYKTINFELRDDVGCVYDDDIVDKGSLGGSCMNGCSNYYEYLEDIGVKILTVYNDKNKLEGRALVWQGVTIGEHTDVVFMDRIYSCNPLIETAFKQYAKEQGWYYKTNQSNTSLTEVTAPNGDLLDCTITYNVDRDVMGYDYMPYLDTLYYYDGKSLNNSSGYLHFRETEGYFNQIECAHCSDYVDEDNTWYVESLEDYVCSDCVEYYPVAYDTDRRSHRDDLYFDEDTAEYYEYPDNLVYCDDDGCYHSEGYYYIEDEDIYVYDISDYYFIEDEGIYVGNVDDYYYIEDKCIYVGNVDGYYYIEDEDIFVKYADDYYYHESDGCYYSYPEETEEEGE